TSRQGGCCLSRTQNTASTTDLRPPTTEGEAWHPDPRPPETRRPAKVRTPRPLTLRRRNGRCTRSPGTPAPPAAPCGTTTTSDCCHLHGSVPTATGTTTPTRCSP